MAHNRSIFTNDAQFELLEESWYEKLMVLSSFIVRSFSMVIKWLLYRECESHMMAEAQHASFLKQQAFQVVTYAAHSPPLQYPGQADSQVTMV